MSGGTIVDQTRDTAGREIYRITRLYSAPVFVKNAAFPDVAGTEDTPAGQFADPVSRAFPIHTKAATWMSAAFFHDAKPRMNVKLAARVEKRINEAATYFSIASEVAALAKTAEANRTSLLDSLPDSDFAFVYDAGGVKERHLPLRNVAEVKAAAAWLERQRDDFIFADRRTIADRILTKAASLAVDLGEHTDWLTRQAGQGVGSIKAAVAAIRLRATLIRREHSNGASQLDKLAAAYESGLAKLDAPGRIKAAAMLDETDRAYHLDREYGKSLERPEDTLFCLTKAAAEALRDDYVHMTSGTSYPREALANLRVADVRDHMGTDFADAITRDGIHVCSEKLAEIVPTLPRGDAELFDQMVASAGITPAIKTAAATRTGLSRDELAALARQHVRT